MTVATQRLAANTDPRQCAILPTQGQVINAW